MNESNDETVVELPALGDVWSSRDGSVTFRATPGGGSAVSVKVGNLTLQQPLDPEEVDRLLWWLT